MDENIYFSKDNLQQIAQMDSQLHFARGIVNRYFSKTKFGAEAEMLLHRIEERQRDEKINISVVGEFSSGKSTFINSLVGYNILPVNVIQGTACVSVGVTNADAYGIRINEKGGNPTQTVYPSFSELQDALSLFLQQTDRHTTVSSADVFLPTASLSQDFRLIDTPGINGLGHQQEEITAKTIKEDSDFSVILIKAMQILPESYCSFLDNIPLCILSKSIFVITKTETFSPKERKELETYTKQKLHERFGLENPVIFSYTAETPTDAESEANCRALQTKMPEIIRQQCAYTKTAKILDGIYYLFSEAEKELTVILEETQREKDCLCRGGIRTFSEIQREFYAHMEHSFSDDMFVTINELRERCREAEERLLRFVAQTPMANIQRNHSAFLQQCYREIDGLSLVISHRMDETDSFLKSELHNFRNILFLAEGFSVMQPVSSLPKCQTDLSQISVTESEGIRHSFSSTHQMNSSIRFCFQQTVQHLTQLYCSHIAELQDFLINEVTQYATAYTVFSSQKSEIRQKKTDEAFFNISQDIQKLQERMYSLQSVLQNIQSN